MIRSLLLACGLLLLSASVGRVEGQATSRSRQLEVVEIRFTGNDAVPDDSLRMAIASRETDCRTAFIAPFCWFGAGFAFERNYYYARQIEDDVVRLVGFYRRQRGFREAEIGARVDTLADSSSVRVTFDIEEGRPIRVDSISFVGDSVAPSFRAGLPVRPGSRLGTLNLDASRDSIVTRLRNAGYAYAEVYASFFIPTGTYEASVEFEIAAGPLTRFGDISVVWTSADSALSRESVLRFLPFEEGDLYSRQRILDAQRSLFGVELIQSATIREGLNPEVDFGETPDTIIPLTVAISEGDVHRVRTGVGWSTADCLNSEARWTSRNFGGDARRLTVRGRVSNVFARGLNDSACLQAGDGPFADLDWLLSTELFQPWLFSTRNSFSARIFTERNSVPDIFIRRAVGLNLSVTRALRAGTPVTLSYSPQLSSLTAAEIFFCTSFLVCAPDDIDLLQSANWLAPLGLSIARDRTDNLLDPAQGYSVRVDLEHASRLTGSDFKYNRVVGEVSLYDQYATRTVGAFRLRGGWVGGGVFEGLGDEPSSEIVHPQKRFYVGGSNSVRGFSQNQLGPRVLTTDVRNLLSFQESGDGGVQQVCTPQEMLDLTCDAGPLGDGVFTPRATGGSRFVEANLEYRFRWGREFQGVTFLDVGQTWGEGERIQFNDLEWSPGVGLRYFSPIGPIRVDVGLRFRGSQELRVITSQIAPFEPGSGRDRICIVPEPGSGGLGTGGCPSDRVPIPWVRLDQLAVLEHPARFGDRGGIFSYLQIHFSIGQAF